MFSKRNVLCFCGIAVAIVAVASLFACTPLYKEEGGDESILSVREKYDQAEERNDIEILQEKMPWLDIISARWKQVVYSDYLDWVPGPTDIGVSGLLTLESDYLREILEKFHWYENSDRGIPGSLLTDEMEGYVLYTSHEYFESYMPLFGGKYLVFFIDFEKEIVFFSFS